MFQPIKSFAAGSSISTAIDENGNIWTWGTDTSEALGNGFGYKCESEPTQITNGINYTSILALRNRTTFVVDETGSVWAWGANEEGVVIPGRGSSVFEPLKLNFEME